MPCVRYISPFHVAARCTHTYICILLFPPKMSICISWGFIKTSFPLAVSPIHFNASFSSVRWGGGVLYQQETIIFLLISIFLISQKQPSALCVTLTEKGMSFTFLLQTFSFSRWSKHTWFQIPKAPWQLFNHSHTLSTTSHTHRVLLSWGNLLKRALSEHNHHLILSWSDTYVTFQKSEQKNSK